MKKHLTLLLFISTILLLSGCIKIPIGDGESIKISKDGFTVSDSEGKETAFSLDSEEGTVSISDSEGSGINFGTNVEIPKRFPSDIPIPKGATVTSAMEIEDDYDEQVATVIYLIESDFDDIVNLYKQYLSDGNFESIADSDSDEAIASMSEIFEQADGNMEFMHGSKEGETYTFQVTELGNEGEISVTIAISEQQNNE